MVDPVTGKFFKGGQFCSLIAAHETEAARPAILTGSHLQVAKATRLRSAWLARLDAKLAGLRGRLETAGRAEGGVIRGEIKRVGEKRWRVAREGDAATIIGRAAQRDVMSLRLVAVA